MSFAKDNVVSLESICEPLMSESDMKLSIAVGPERMKKVDRVQSDPFVH
jgi:hypothetical protein